MLTVLKVVCLVTVGFLISSLGVWQAALVAVATAGLSLLNFVDGFYEGYTKATNEILKATTETTKL